MKHLIGWLKPFLINFFSKVRLLNSDKFFHIILFKLNIIIYVFFKNQRLKFFSLFSMKCLKGSQGGPVGYSPEFHPSNPGLTPDQDNSQNRRTTTVCLKWTQFCHYIKIKKKVKCELFTVRFYCILDQYYL